MRDPKEPGDIYNMKEHVYHDSNIVQGLPNEDLKVHVKDAKQKVTNKSKNSKKNVYDKPVEQTMGQKHTYAEPHAHQPTTTETSAGRESKQKSKDSSAGRSAGNSKGSLGKDFVAKVPDDGNRAPKRRELITSPQAIDIEAVPTSFVENETGEPSGIKLISKKDLDGGKTDNKPTRTPTLSALTRHQTWKNEDGFGTTTKAVKPGKQQPVVTREAKHFRRNALIITLFLATILIIVAIVVVCLIILP